MDEEQRENSESKVPKNLQPHIYKKGQSGNPNGRPKGSISLKEYARRMIQKMTPEEREEYLEGLDKKFIWEMAEGKAESKTESKVEVTLPTPLLANIPTENGVSSDNSTEENTESQEAN